MLHPATLFFSWLIFAASLQWLPAGWVSVLAVPCVALALVLAPERSINLLRRSRWLLISLVVLYFFATPGEYLPGILGDIGLTYEGIHQGAEQVSRLLAMLTSLAMSHQMLGTRGLLAGLHCLLKPFPGREATVVRLMLVLDYVEQKHQIGWREWLLPSFQGEGMLSGSLVLDMPRFHWPDGVMALLLVGVFVVITVLP